MTTPPAAAVPVQGPRPVRVWDLVLSIVLLVLSAMLGLLLFVLSPFLVMASDPCGAAVECNTTQMAFGFELAMFGPAIVIIAGIVATITLLALRKLAFWVPLVASVLAIGIFIVGAAIVVSGVPGATF